MSANKDNRYQIIAIIGKAGSGKDTLLNNFFTKSKNKKNIHKIISYTTRPPRENEIENKDYFFVSKEEFADKVINFEMLEATEFRNWHYGTGLNSLDKNKVNIGVFNPAGVEILSTNPNVDLYIIEVIANDKERVLRQLNREDNPDVDEIVRRYTTDYNDFYNLDVETYLVPNNSPYDLEVAIEFLENIVVTTSSSLNEQRNKKGQSN